MIYCFEIPQTTAKGSTQELGDTFATSLRRSNSLSCLEARPETIGLALAQAAGAVFKRFIMCSTYIDEFFSSIL